MEEQKTDDPIQMEMAFNFKTQYSDLALRETVRGVKAITREIIRLGGADRIVESVLDLLAVQNPIIREAADAIEERIELAAEARDRSANR